MLVILTCFNRKKKTENCIKNIVKSNPKLDFTFIIVDDKSTDGTIEVLETLKKEYSIYIIRGSGDLYYSNGMRIGMDFALNTFEEEFKYLLLVNDDVEFYNKSIEKIILNSLQFDKKTIIVGATCNSENKLSYGAIKYLTKQSIKYRKVGIDEIYTECDTFNANCVLIPYSIFKTIGSYDNHYVHSLGDFDYGLKIKKHGYKIYSSQDYIGLCNGNSIKGTWQDNSLGFVNRIKIKEKPKGAPIKEWYYFLKKNFGIIVAIKFSFTPYLRIVLGK